MSKILLVDDHALCRESLAAHLLRHEGASRVLEASNAQQGLRLFSTEHTEVVVLSIDLPEGGVFEAARAMRHIVRETRILLLAERSCDSDIEEALALPVQGIVLKRDTLASLCKAIQLALSGGVFFSESIEKRIEQVNGRLILKQASSPIINSLSPRERQLLVHLGRGISLKQAAATMAISYKTADNQKASLMRKLDIHDRVELARFAIREGLVSLAPHPLENPRASGTAIGWPP